MNFVINNLNKKLEKQFHNLLDGRKYIVKEIRANELLSYNRLDIAFKLAYLEFFKKDTLLSQCIYKDHIRALTLGKFEEPGNPKKNKLEVFYNEFKKNYKNIKEHGFDSNISLIVLSKNNSIANGSHRVAISIFLQKKIFYIKLPVTDSNYNYNFFLERKIKRQNLEIAVNKFVNYSHNTYVAFLWPAAKGGIEKIENILGNIVYKKEIKLSYNGAHNLISHIYKNESWLGDYSNNFKGAKNKLALCFNNDRPLKVYFFQEHNLKNVLKKKEQIRNIYGINKNSIHITDKKEEAKYISEIILNDNCLHFLNYGKPSLFLKKRDVISEIKKNLHQNDNDYVISGNVVQLIYGIKNDFDYEVLTKNSIKKTPLNNLSLVNPKHFFVYRGIKFMSLEASFKLYESFQTSDVKSLLNKKTKDKSSFFKKELVYIILKLKIMLIIFLTRLGIYEVIRKIFKK